MYPLTVIISSTKLILTHTHAGADLGVGQGGPGTPWQIFTYESH